MTKVNFCISYKTLKILYGCMMKNFDNYIKRRLLFKAALNSALNRAIL
jgi:hypothetical protein